MVNIKQKKIFSKILKRKEEKIESRIEDAYYADSWEQSVQISQEISELREDINSIEAFLRGEAPDARFWKIVDREIWFRTYDFRFRKRTA